MTSIIGLIPSRVLLAGAGIILVAVSVFLLFMQFGSGQVDAYAVLLNGEEIAVIPETAAVTTALDAVLRESAVANTRPYFEEDIQFKQVNTSVAQFTSTSELEQIFKGHVKLAQLATSLVIEGTHQLFVADMETAEAIINQVKEAYLPKSAGIIPDSVEVEIVQQLEMQSSVAPPEEIMSQSEAVEFIINGVKDLVTYTVDEGDSLWTIARNNDLRVEDLRQSNPQLTSDLLKIGQTLKLTKIKPLLTVRAAYREKAEEKIAYTVKIENDSKLWRGQEQVKQSGQEGLREVEYQLVAENGIALSKDVLKTKIIREPKIRVVSRGTKVMLASRGAGGNGILGWPTRGRITSKFGYRGREFHTGLDIDGTTGDPVLAAERGEVGSAGWAGNLGNLATIDHGNGLVTRYAHLSRILVKPGQKVERGDVVGLVGSTGRSTGSHLHFEVLDNGNFRNPLTFFER